MADVQIEELNSGDGVRPPRAGNLAGAVLARGGVALAGVVVLIDLLAAVLVPVHGWRPPLVVPLVLLLVAFSAPLVRRVPAVAVPSWTTLACVAIAVGHGVWAGLTHAEHVVLRRDAGSYALYTQWISTHHGLQIPSQLDAFGGAAALADPAFRLGSPAFFQVTTGGGAEIVPQFFLGAPAVYSLGWWTTGGFAGVFVMPAIASAAALLALAGLAARLVGPRWAVLATAALAICQPMLHAARSTYSEPVALLVVAAAAALLVDATRATGRAAVSLGWAAGLGFGFAGLIRVDALREVSLLLPVCAVLALRKHPAARPIAFGALFGTAIAVVPAVLLSRPYLGNIGGSLVPLVGLTVVLGAGAWVAARWGTAIGRRLPTIARLPELTAGLVLLVGVVLAARPLFMTVHQSAADPGSKVVAGLQLRQGLTVDGGRTYAEHSVQWLSWYVGPLVLVAALLTFAGLAGLSVRWWRSDETEVPGWLGPAVVALGSIVLTLYRPGITPDHPWADRRMVPIVFPAVIIAAVAFLAWLVRRMRTGPALKVTVATVGAVAVLLPTWAATAPVAGAAGRTEVGEVAAAQKVCAQLDPSLDAVVALDARSANEWPQLIRGLCGVPASSVKIADPDRGADAVRGIVARITEADRRPVLIAAQDEGRTLMKQVDVSQEPQVVADLATREDQRYLERRPDGTDPLGVQLWMIRL
ncbi:hypothetical protein ACIB24_15200 [Spongisporangium articulatum]|uniref:Glycosyltransferase RgtA/B/C/D-like domain-containing protein n=1 Tax=Spongisporangium articulatum TaxID=3362603 RepID=A0ABW8APW6_9ACTN